MSIARKSSRDLKTMADLSDRGRSRSAAGAFLKLFVLATEKDRLKRELATAERRRGEIQARLAEIAEKEKALNEFVKEQPPVVDTAVVKAAPEFRGVKTKEIQY